MKKILPLLALLLLLSACGASGEKKAPQESARTETAENTAGSAAENAPANGALTDPIAQAARVENNGGYFVRLDGKVYFRKYGPDALEKMTLFGEFLEYGHMEEAESEIVSYDLMTRRVETVFTDTGYGRLYYGDGGLYLQERVSRSDATDIVDAVVWHSLDGARSRTLAYGRILGVTDSGLLAVEDSNLRDGNGGFWNAFRFYRDGEEQGSFTTPASFSFVGLSDDGLFLIEEDYEGGEDQPPVRTLWQLPPDAHGGMLADREKEGANGDAICLGILPEADWIVSVEPGQFVATENQIGVMIGYYAGTGHFLNDCAAVTAIPGQAESLTILDAPDEWEDEDTGLPKLFVDEGGEIALTEHLPGELEIGWKDGEEGDLRLYDGSGWETLERGLCPARADGSGYEKIVQSMEYLDGSAYVTLALAHASPLDDIGWRSAYTLLDMIYLVIPAAQGEGLELACVDHEAALEGNVWFLEDHSALLWQQTSSDPEAYGTEADYAYRIPIAADAEWYTPNGNGQESILADAVYTSLPAEADYFGYPVPEGEPGQFLRFRLNRDGEISFLTNDRGAVLS